MKVIALFDNYQGGHHLSYLQLFSKSLLELGFEVWVFCCQSDSLSDWVKGQVPNCFNALKVFEVKTLPYPNLSLVGKLPRLFSVLQEWRYAAQSIHRAAKEIGQTPDVVFFAWLDSYLSPYLSPWLIEKIFPHDWAGLYFTPFHLREGERLLPVLGKPVSAYNLIHSVSCKGLGLLDELEAKRLQGQFDKPIIYFPDLTDETEPDQEYKVAQQIRLAARERTIITLIGGLTPRKGLMTLLETAQRLQDKDYHFVFAGQLNDFEFSDDELTQINKFVHSKPNNCSFHFSRIPTESQFNSIIASSDILFAAYRNFPFSSNLITKSAVFEKPIIVSQGYHMAAAVEAYNLGLTIPEDDVESCIKAINYLEVSLKNNFQSLQPNFAGYRQKNSAARLQETFKSLFCSTGSFSNTSTDISQSLS